MLLFVAYASRAQLPSQDPGHKQNSVVAGVKFSVPKHFELHKSSTPNLAFMLHAQYDLGLFVAIPDRQVDEKYERINPGREIIAMPVQKSN